MWSTVNQESRKESREISASFISRLTFGWINEMVDLGNIRPLEEKDLWRVTPGDDALSLQSRFDQLRHRRASLFWKIIRMFWRQMALQLTFGICAAVLNFAKPAFLNLLLAAIEDSQQSLAMKGYLVGGMFFATLLKVVCEGQLYHVGRRVGMQSAALLNTEIYKKTLRRAPQPGSADDDDDQGSGMGKIVTLMSVDTARVGDYLCYSHTILITPVEILIATAALVYILGWPALSGVVVMILTIPTTAYVGKWTSRAEETLMEKTDKRVEVTNEVLNGIRIIKYLAWEPQFFDKIREARKAELASLVQVFYADLASTFIWQLSPLLVAFVTFATFTKLAGNPLDATTAFTGLSLLNALRLPLNQFPNELVDFWQALVSLKRIEDYLNQEELEDTSNCRPETALSEQSGRAQRAPKVGFEQSSYVRFVLKNLNIEFPLGKLTVVCGPTGCGKSSMLLALLGDSPHQVAYVAQTAWLFNGSIRDNICFGRPYDRQRYAQVIFACALVRDLQQLEDGDMTEIGEKGINLSGGQKQRVSLARAAYSRASVVLMDDPLSAVDAPTARHIFQHCVLGFLQGRTRILVSHAVSLTAHRADKIVVMKGGEVVADGAFETVASSGVSAIFENLVLPEAGQMQSENAVEEEDNLGITHADDSNARKLVEDEEKSTGSVSIDVYKTYFQATGGASFLVPFLSAVALINGLQVLSDWWIKKWTESESSLSFASALGTMFTLSPDRATEFHSWWNMVANTSGIQFQLLNGSVDFYLGCYGLIGVTLLLTEQAFSLLELKGSYRASEKLHSELLHRILRAPMRFFETTPLGRIMNRFSRDIERIDQNVIQIVGSFVSIALDCVTIFLVISIITPVFLVTIAPIVYLYLRTAQKYLNCSRELKRLDSVSRSPVYSLLSETLNGVSTIRAYGDQQRFTDMVFERIDANNRAHFWLWTTNRWLGVRIEFIGAVVVLAAAAIVTATAIPAGLAGLSLIYALQFTDILLWVIRIHAQMEMNMNSVERVREYLEIEQEPPGIIEGHRPPENWPENGEIRLVNVSAQYTADQPKVLKDLTFTIHAREKIGVVGRTGAGKSSLSLVLFRILPIIEGSIVIDSIDVFSIGLQDLRSRLTIIPQDPVLFAGTLRTNLDPLGEHDDSKLWSAIGRVHFLESFHSATDENSSIGLSANQPTITLETKVAENGGNFSQGQRQLICLARALLRRSKVIILDEATASIDAESDRRIQETIRSEFSGATVLCIAHRLRTVMDYDRIIVMDHGQVVEMDTPLNLVLQQGSAYRRMCEETGELNDLIQIASDSAHKRHPSGAH
ncbi:P-loop containing nucleoside triphosphate hydrolase protein [Polychytrium aggregatum]|uniref:P-loop containing nucleoside triphosphate hydrolase protein n=1 Tax=Polychytrium aggregatum TaxID=110093 RepID=UPI0022FEA15D|nr:P-loop containing nucleoside triphosphate hydrolase protein [Polychytrium aggregatum]KAI9203555.1 P-loop containing nucleoside triphosphate hydrolase protein [Polychytrium aggregatum]